MSKTSPAVLVVEDDPNTLAGYVEILEAAGLEALAIGNGADALALAIRNRPDIVLTDLAVPGLNGFLLTKALRTDDRTCGIPVIGVTGLVAPDLRGQATKVGMNTLLLKPCMPEHLLAEIRRVLNHRRGTNGSGGGGPLDRSGHDRRDPPNTGTR